MLLLSRVKRSWGGVGGGGVHFWKERVIDFIPCQQVPTTRKSRTESIKRTLFFLSFFGEGVGKPLESHVFQNSTLSLCKYKYLCPVLKLSQFNFVFEL